MTRWWWLCLLGLIAGCPSEPSSAAPVEPATAPPAPPSARIGTHPVRDLAKEAARAELRSAGLTIDLGSPDEHKYLDPFSPPGELGLVFANRSSVARVLVRARAPKRRHTIGVAIDGKRVGRRRLSQDWQTVELRLSAAIGPGIHRLAIGPTRGVEIDWVRLRGRGEETPETLAPKVETVTFGAPRQALVADPPRALSYFLQVPEEGRLVFDYGADRPVEFEVYAARDGHDCERLFSAESKVGVWTEGSVDLSPLAHEIVRLDLVTDGEAGRAAWGEPHVVVPGPALRPATLPRKGRLKNVIFVVIDTLRRDAVSAFNPKTRVKMPHFAALAADSTLFTSAYTTAPWTKPSVASILTGLYPSTHGAFTEEAMLPDDVPLLPEHLRARGFTTALFSANGYVSDRFGFDRGWDRYVNFPREHKKTQAEFVYRDVLAWVRGQDPEKPFFLYVQTVDPHVPYQAPSRYLHMYFDGTYRGHLGLAISGYEHDDYNDGKLRLSALDRAYLTGQYFGEISYHDAYFGRFIDGLRELGLLDSTLLVVTNDHGEELFDHGQLGHGQSLHEELVRSPLLVRAPGVFPAGAQVDQIVSLVDLTPTVLEVLGVAPMSDLEGLSLVAAVQGHQALNPPCAISERQDLERSIRLGRYKLIATEDAPDQLYDVEADPNEEKDLSEALPIVHRTLSLYLFEGLSVPKKVQRLAGLERRKRHLAPDAKIDPELKEHLKAMGYFND